MKVNYNRPCDVQTQWASHNLDRFVKPGKLSLFDLRDHERAIQRNIIPVWVCSRCTFRNVQRRSTCSICSFSYKSCNAISHFANESKTRSIIPVSATLADFCSNVMDEMKNSISVHSVWTCDQCTFCNPSSSFRCQVCDHPYSNQPHPVSTSVVAEQRMIMESVLSNESQHEREHKSIANNEEKLAIVNNCKSADSTVGVEVVQKHLPGTKTAKTTINITLRPLRNDVTAAQQRKKWSLNKLKRMRYVKECIAMPQKIHCPMPNILAPGLGTKTGTQQAQRRKISIAKLLSVRYDHGYDQMPDHMFDNSSRILLYGLGQSVDKQWMA